MTVKANDPEGQNPYAVVVGLDSLNGIQCTRILAERNIPVIAIAKDPQHYGCRTKLCDRILFANTTNDDFILSLEKLGPKLVQKAVLFPCIDMSVLLVSQHRKRLENLYHIALPSHDVVGMMMNKMTFYSFAHDNGFSIPQTFILNSREDVSRASDRLTFPCTIKPPNSAIPTWEQNSKLKAYKVLTPGELLTTYEFAHEWSTELIVQEWIEGPDSNLYSCNCYFNAESTPMVTFVARKLRQWPPVTGESSLGQECRDDYVLNETVRLFRKI
ncbi:MAG: carboxylate--amine ligase, partial [Candidatus Hermodarchaeia archaeon]